MPLRTAASWMAQLLTRSCDKLPNLFGGNQQFVQADAAAIAHLAAFAAAHGPIQRVAAQGLAGKVGGELIGGRMVGLLAMLAQACGPGAGP